MRTLRVIAQWLAATRSLRSGARSLLHALRSEDYASRLTVGEFG